MRIVFECKDQRLLDWYEKLWRSRFQAELDEYRGVSLDDAGREELAQHWHGLMSFDAYRQEHHDYKMVDGERQVLGPEDLDGAAFHLLYPSVSIVD